MIINNRIYVVVCETEFSCWVTGAFFSEDEAVKYKNQCGHRCRVECFSGAKKIY
jgi:hypothetical protein